MIPPSSNLRFKQFSAVVLLSFVFPFLVWRKCFPCKAFIHRFLATCISSDVGTLLGVGIFLSFWTKRFVYAVILKHLIDDAYFVFIYAKWCHYFDLPQFLKIYKNTVASYNVVGPLTSDWILFIVSWLIFSMFHVDQEGKSSFNHSGPLHHKVLCFNSLLLIPLLGRSAGLSFVLIYLNSTFFSFVISVIRFFTNTYTGFLVFNQFKMHWEFFQIILRVFPNPIPSRQT